MSRQAGFGLLEALLALALGLMLLAAAGQVFAASYQAWRLQGAATRLQDDARLALQRMAEDIRMAGMFGCLRLEAADFDDPADAQVFSMPIDAAGERLTLVGAELPGLLGAPDWTVLTDCQGWARVYRKPPPTGAMLALPVRRVTYRLSKGRLMFTTHAQHASLIDNVRALDVRRVGARVDIQLVMFDPVYRLEQHHALSVALRNLG